ncbi:ankyrin repeat-containing domain protein, partial [Baffinella frigidus]
MAALEIPEGIKEFLRKDNARDLLGEVERGNLDVNALYSLSAGRSLLHDACLLGAPYCCKALLALDASPNIQTHGEGAFRETPLHLACYPKQAGCEQKQEECLAALLRSQVRGGGGGRNGKTALHIAAKSNSVPCVLALLRAGADTKLEDTAERTARTYAEHYKAKEAVAAIDGHLAVQETRAMQVETAQNPPYAPVLDEPEYGPATEYLPKAVYDQINYMIREDRLNAQQVTSSVLTDLKGMSSTRALAEIKEYDHRMIMW